ncbi:hypothetical protein [Maritalea sp.]|uniref:hypothetical protein n=1 Tax=Maritalea sp. TaxID=2003361 RepID=UPI003EFB1F62
MTIGEQFEQLPFGVNFRAPIGGDAGVGSKATNGGVQNTRITAEANAVRDGGSNNEEVEADWGRHIGTQPSVILPDAEGSHKPLGGN